MAVGATTVAAGPKYLAEFERTEKRLVEGNSTVVLDKFTDPADDRLKALIANGKTGYLRITEIATGKKIHGIQTSASQAVALMKSCLGGKYNPFPRILNKKREVSE